MQHDDGTETKILSGIVLLVNPPATRVEIWKEANASEG